MGALLVITRVRVKNFRSLADVDVTLGPLTVLVGRNGAGKSAFVDALGFVRDALRSGLNEALRKRNGLAALQTRYANNVAKEMAFDVSVQLENFSAEYGFAIAPKEQAEFFISREYLRISSEGMSKTMFEVKSGQIIVMPDLSFYAAKNEPSTGKQSENSSNLFADPPAVHYWNMHLDPAKLMFPRLSIGSADAEELLTHITATCIYGMFPIASLRQPQSDYHDMALSEDGSNLAALLNYKKIKGILPIIKAALQSAVPDVENIAIDRVGSFLVVELQHRRAREGDGEQWFDLAQESDGTIHLLTMLAALYQTLSPGLKTYSLVAIEEPETALYPAVLSLLGDIVKEASCRSQLIITTQSPDFISEFGTETLRVVEKINGATHIGPLDEVQVGIIHDQLFTTGDLLRVEELRSLPAQPVSAENA